MKCRSLLAGIVFAVPALFVQNPSPAAEASKLVAPIYPGAVPAIAAEGTQADPSLVLAFDGGKALDCNGNTLAKDIAGRPVSIGSPDEVSLYAGPWCFLSRDPVDKVKAFYDKAIATMKPVQGDKGVHGYQVVVERAWFDGDGVMTEAGYAHNAVSVHALAAPPVKGKAAAAPAMGDETWAGQEDYGFYAQTRFFGQFLDAVDLLGDPSKRPVTDLDQLYAKNNYLEAAIFQRRGPNLESVDAMLAKKYGDLRVQRQQAAQTGMMSAFMQQNMAASQMSAGPTAEEDAQFNAVMAADPALQQRYTSLTQQGAMLMQQGKFDEADAVFDEIDELEAAHPELAAMNSQQQARSAQISASSQAAEQNILANSQNQLDQAIWGTGLEMLAELDKDDYYTLIVIDNAFAPTAKEYTRDRGTIEAETANWVPHQTAGIFDIHYPSSGVPAVTDQAPAEPEKKEGVGSKLKRGLGILRDIGGDR